MADLPNCAKAFLHWQNNERVKVDFPYSYNSFEIDKRFEKSSTTAEQRLPKLAAGFWILIFVVGLIAMLFAIFAEVDQKENPSSRDMEITIDVNIQEKQK